jgi:hypothetical protein
MTDSIPFESISDDELHTTVRRLTARSNGVLADLLAHLGEVELRGIHRTRACASLYMYCIYELRMSEDAAFRRANNRAGEPERPLRYKVQFTAGQEYVDLVNEAFDLVGHEMRRPDLPDLQLRAMRELVKQLKRRKRGATERPPGPDLANGAATGTAETAPARGDGNDSANTGPARVHTAHTARARGNGNDSADTAPARYIPSAVRRAVWARDGERCAYVDDRGHRCCETRGLELHHCLAFALGGPSTFDNLEVRCRAHNALAAESDFGRVHMGRARGELFQS